MSYTNPVDGIDVSHYQLLPDWPTVRANCRNPDMALAVFKVSQRTDYVDPTYVRNRAGVAAAGFRWRFGYHWLTPGNVDPIKQADWFLSHFVPGDHEGVLLDAEEDKTGVINGSVTPEEADAFAAHVESTTGRPVAVYTGVHVNGGALWHSARLFNGRRVRWLAAYIPELRMKVGALPFEPDVWQGDGGATGRFPGVTGGVDLNKIYNPIMLDLACGISAAPIPDLLEDSVKTEAHPARVLDTRALNGPPVAAGQVLTVPFYANEVEVVIHVVGPTGSGYVVAWGVDPKPPISQLDFTAGINATGTARVVLDAGILKVMPSAPCHIVVDLVAKG